MYNQYGSALPFYVGRRTQRGGGFLSSLARFDTKFENMHYSETIQRGSRRLPGRPLGDSDVLHQDLHLKIRPIVGWSGTERERTSFTRTFSRFFTIKTHYSKAL
jgi:hypothetical protein